MIEVRFRKYCDICGVSEDDDILSGKSTDLIPISIIFEDEVGNIEACPECSMEIEIFDVQNKTIRNVSTP